MPHFGPGIVGHEIYERQVEFEKRTANNHFGPGITGEVPQPAQTVERTRSVRDVLAALQAGGDVQALYAEEVGRPGGPRKTVLRALIAAGNARAMDPDFLAEMAATQVGGEE